MSLPRGVYQYEMEDPDFVIEFGPDAKRPPLQVIRIIDYRTYPALYIERTIQLDYMQNNVTLTIGKMFAYMERGIMSGYWHG